MSTHERKPCQRTKIAQDHCSGAWYSLYGAVLGVFAKTWEKNLGLFEDAQDMCADGSSKNRPDRAIFWWQWNLLFMDDPMIILFQLPQLFGGIPSHVWRPEGRIPEGFLDVWGGQITVVSMIFCWLAFRLFIGGYMMIYIILCYIILCYIMLCYIILCYVMLCYVILYYIIWYCMVLYGHVIYKYICIILFYGLWVFFSKMTTSFVLPSVSIFVA